MKRTIRVSESMINDWDDWPACESVKGPASWLAVQIVTGSWFQPLWKKMLAGRDDSSQYME